MAVIRPFNAVRPTRDKVSLIASRSYQSYTPAEREARLDHNPYSFLHIVNPGYKYQKVINGEERFELVRNRYQEFKEDGIFIKDKVPSLPVKAFMSSSNSFKSLRELLVLPAQKITKTIL